MDNQPIEQKLNDAEIVMRITQQIGDYPSYLPQIQWAIKEVRKKDKQLAAMDESYIRKIVIQANLKIIELQFVDMMQKVLKKIQPELRDFPKYKSIKYLDAIIYEHLDTKIYGKDIRISKIRNTLLDNETQTNQNTADMLFTELITVMNELLQVMKQHYGYQRDQKVSGILFQCIHMFVIENQDCFLVLQDKKSSTQQKSKMSTSKAKTALETAESLVGTIYAGIKQINPFSDKLTQQQKLKKQQLFKNTKKMKKREPLDENTIKIMQELASMDPLQIIMTLGDKQKQQFTTLLIDALEESSKIKNKSKLKRIQHIENQITDILSSTMDIQFPKTQDKLKQFKQLKWIVILYKALEKSYYEDPQRRKWLMKFCQNKIISQKLHNPFAIIKALQSDKLEQSEILKLLRAMPVSLPQVAKKVQNPKDNLLLEAHLAVQHELNRIHLYQFKKKYAKEPHLEIERLTSHKRRVITFFFSGFLSQDTCKASEWSGILNNFYDSEVYSVRWQSKTVKNMIQYGVKSVVDLGPTQSIAMLGGPYIKAIAIMHNLYQKFQQNPFNPAFEAAVTTGQFMAEFILNNFKGYFVNFVGFSLGTEVIKNIMKRLAQKNSLHIINKVYFIGGVADKTQVENLLQASPSPLTITNLYSDNDYVLKYLLRLCKSGITPIGLNSLKQIEGHVIKNEDCSYYVEGHLSYRSNLQFYAKVLKMADD